MDGDLFKIALRQTSVGWDGPAFLNEFLDDAFQREIESDDTYGIIIKAGVRLEG